MQPWENDAAELGGCLPAVQFFQVPTPVLALRIAPHR